MKPLVFKIAVLFLLCCNGSLFGQGTGYVRLEGKQFVDHLNVPFYPMIMNWSASLIFDGTNYWPSPTHTYGPTHSFECSSATNCRDQILNQFTYISDLGFNGIRLNGLFPFYNVNSNQFQFDIYKQNVQKWPPLNVSDSQDRNIVFNAYLELLDIAENVPNQPFYIIINTGGQSNNDENGIEIFPWSIVQPFYVPFLKELGGALMNQSHLLAYDLYNEPCFAVNRDPMFTKNESCLLVEEWVGAIKTYDGHHLTTIGNCWDETIKFDPSCLKIDFNSPHFYPLPSFYGRTVQTIQTEYQQQVQGILYWLGKNMPIPWIVGETGFTAIDADPSNPTWQNELNGTEAQQEDYARFVFPMTRNCEASGFSWWNYQDGFNIDNAHPKRGNNFFGILYRGITSCPDPLNPCQAMNKPVAGYFSSINPNPPPVDPANCMPPANYLDPYNHKVKNSNGIGEVTGTVTDQDGNPIGDALVYGWGWLYTETIGSQVKFYHYPFYSFSNPDPVKFPLALGEFKIRPYNYLSPSAANDQILTNIWFAGLGLENKDYGSWTAAPLTQNNFMESLRRINFGYNGIANNQTISLSPRNLRGGESLLVKNSTITASGISEITAQKKIYLENFRAEAGAYVHIYPAKYDHCVSYDGLRIINPFGDSNSAYNENRNNELILNFSTSSRIVISPNPANDIINIQLKGFQEGVIIKILTPEGREIGNYSITDPGITKINTNGYNSGMYILVATDQLNQQTTRFIISH